MKGAVMSQENSGQNVLDILLAETQFMPGEEGYDIARGGVEALLGQLAKQSEQIERVDKLLVDRLIAQIDERVSRQVDAIIHHQQFQNIEAPWRSLKFLVDRSNFRENIKIDLFNVSKADLAEDFMDSPEIVKSGLYKLVYTKEYGQFGGEPYGALIGNYAFDHSAQDVKLLQNIGAVSAMSHAPFIASVSPKMFGVNSIEKLPDLKDVRAIFEGKLYEKWRSFRNSDDSRYVGLTLPRFLLRQPYEPEQNPTKSFNYHESIQGHDDYLWGNAAFAFATRLTDSFAKYRWCPNVIGPTSGGEVADLPLHHFESMGDLETKVPTEVLISDRREFELAEHGFIPLAFRKGSDNATFFSANSIQMPRYFGSAEDSKEQELNFKLGTQLPYMFIVCRIAHYLKVLQREQLGSWREARDLENELNKWISQYIANQDNAPAEVRSRKPLRQAQVKVSNVQGEPGWYRVDIAIRPHFKYMGADITLSLAGRIEMSKEG